MIQAIDIAKIEILESGELAIYPSALSPSYQYVYRAAMGVYWNEATRRFQAPHAGYDAKGKTVTFWIKLIQSAVQSELGIDLILTKNTQWLNISDAEMEAARADLVKGV